MSKSKNVRSAFNQIINEVRYGRGLNVGDDDAPKRDRGPYHQGAGMYTGAFAEKNPLLKNVAVAHLGEVHPDKDVDRGLDFINSFRGHYSNTHLYRYVKTSENPNAISNGYGRFLTDEQQEKIRGFHEKLLSKYSPSDTETARYHPESVDYHKQLGSMINTELGSAIIDAHKKHAFSDDVHNAARLAGSTNPKHMEELKGIHERNKDNPHFGTLVSKHPITTHKWNDMDKFNRMIANGNFHNKPNEIDSIVDPAVRQAGGSLPPNQTMESNNLYRKGIRALFESVLDEARKTPEGGFALPSVNYGHGMERLINLAIKSGDPEHIAKMKQKAAQGGRQIKNIQRERENAPKVKAVNASTQITYRNGIRALFEAILEEEGKILQGPVPKRLQQTSKPTTPATISWEEAQRRGQADKAAREAKKGTVVGSAQNIVGAASQKLSTEDEELQAAWKKTAKEKFEPREDSSHNIRKAFQSILSENDLWRAKRNVHRDVVNAARGDKNALSNLKSHASGRELVNTYHKLHADFKDLNLKRGMSEDEAHMGAHHEASAEVERLVSDHGYYDPSKPFEGMPRAK